MEDLRHERPTGRPGPARRAPARGADPWRVHQSQPSKPSGDDLARLWERLRKDLRSMGGDVRSYAELRLQRVSLATQEGALGLLFGGWLALFAVVATVTAAILLVLGLAQGVSALVSGSTWVGRIAVGTLMILLVSSAFVLLRRRIEKRFAERIRRRFGDASPQDERFAANLKQEPTHEQ